MTNLTVKNWHKKITLILIGLLLAVHILPIVYAKAETNSKEIYYADQDYITLKVDQKQDQYRLSIESKNLGSLDWVGYVFRLKPEDFASQKDFKQKVISNRSFYSDEDQPLGLVYATAKSVFRYLDVLSTLIDFATKEIFGSAIIDTVNVPANEPAIYLVRAYSGSWGKLIDEGEKSFVREKLTNGKIRDGQALGLNLFAIILDTASLVVPFDKSISQDDLRKIAVAGLTEISHKFSQPDFMQGRANAKDFNQVVVGGAAAMLKEFLNILKDEAAKNFLKFAARSLQIAADTVIVLDKVSKGGKIADRIAQLLTLGTPLETSYLTVNDAVAKLAKEEVVQNGDDIKNWKTFDRDTWSVKYPPSDKSCDIGASEFFVCLFKDDVPDFAMGELNYSDPNDPNWEPFTCGKDFNECKNLLYNSALYEQIDYVKERVINGFSGVEMKATRKPADGHFEKQYIAEINSKEGTLYIVQKRFLPETDDIYEKILATLKRKAISGQDGAQLKAQPKQPPVHSKRLTVQLADQYMIPVSTLGIGYAYGQTPDMYLLDAVGDRFPGQFCSPKGCVELGGFRVGQKEASGIWEFSKDIPYGNYTIVYTEGGCCGNTDILREWSGFTKKINITNDSERFVKASVETKWVKIPVYFKVNLINQIGTPINDKGNDFTGRFPCYLLDKSGKQVSIQTIGFISCSSNTLMGTNSAPLSPGDYILHIEKTGYLPFKKTINIPDVSALNDNEIRAKIPEIKGNLTLIKNNP